MCEVMSKTLLLKNNNIAFQINHCFPTCALFYPIVLKRIIITEHGLNSVSLILLIINEGIKVILPLNESI